MTRRWIGLGVAAFVVLAGVMRAQSVTQSDREFQAALQQEMVLGDLQGAIATYRAIAARPGVDRALAATALMRAGEIYQKLGDRRAQDVFSEVVNRYGDQAVAADARKRLAALGGAAAAASQGSSTRTVWAGPKVSNGGVVSRDGRWLPYTDWSTGNLAVHDLVNDRDLVLTDAGNFPPAIVREQQYAGDSRVSPDGDQVAFGWFNSERYEIRLVDIEPSGAKPRALFNNPDVSYIQPFDWSPDGRRLLVELLRGDGNGQIALLTVADGSLIPLKSFTWRASSSHAAFSPDGQYIGYDLPGDAPADERDVYILAVDGSREMRVTTHPRNDRMVGWSRDGTRVIFASDRTGTEQLWAQPWSGQTLVEKPQVVPSSFSGEAIGFTRDEALFERKTTYAGSLFRTVSFDFELGRATSAPVDPGEEFYSRNLSSQALWSPDGRKLALARLDRPGEMMMTLVSILDLNMRNVTHVRPQMAVGPLAWALDGRSFLSTGQDLKSRRGLYQIAIESGEISRLPEPSDREGRNVGTSLAVAPDGSEIFVRRADPQTIRFVARNLTSGVERELASWPRTASDATDVRGPSLSPDGRQIVTAVTDSATESSVILIAPASGAKRTLWRGAVSAAQVLMWAPDNRSVFVRWTPVGVTPAEPEVWRVPVAGGEPAKVLWTLGHDNRDFRVHPDGRRLVYVVNGTSSQSEVRVLTNLLSSSR